VTDNIQKLRLLIHKNEAQSTQECGMLWPSLDFEWWLEKDVNRAAELCETGLRIHTTGAKVETDLMDSIHINNDKLVTWT